MLELLKEFKAWIENGYCMIVNKAGLKVPLVPNRAQVMIVRAMYKQAKAGLPIRQVILKSRQQGTTTLVMSWLSFVTMMKPNMNAFSMSHRMPELKTKFREVPTALMHDSGTTLATENTTELVLGNGSSYRIGTGQSAFAQSGVTCQLLHITEGSKYTTTQGTANVTSALSTVPMTPNTTIIYESTANGMDSIHYKQFKDATNIPEHPYHAIFLPWFLVDGDAVDTKPLIRTDEEHLMAEQAKQYDIVLSDEQLAFRRNKALENENWVNQEFCTTAQQAVEHSEGLIYENIHLGLIDELPAVDWDISMMFSGFDGGLVDPCALISAYLHKNTIYIYDTFHGSDVPLLDIAQHMHEGTCYADPSSAREQSELRQLCGKKTHIVKAPRRKVTGDTDFISEEIRLVQNVIREGRLKLLRSCSEPLIEEAMNYFSNKATGKPIDRRVDGGHFDLLAALKYLCMGIERQGTETGQLVQIPPKTYEHKYNRRFKTKSFV